MNQDTRRPKQGFLISALFAVPAFALAASVGTRQINVTALVLGVAVGLAASRLPTRHPGGALLFILALVGISLAPVLVVRGWWPAGPLIVFLLAGFIAVGVQILRNVPNDPRSAARARGDDEGDEAK
jgi:hypothetical protein